MPSFHLPDDQLVRVPADALLRQTSSLFQTAGLAPEDADLAADVLVRADLRGVDTHGVSNMLPWYLDSYRSGKMNPRPAWRLTRETPATANMDSDRGLGIVIAPRAMQIAIDKARNTGIGYVTIHNSQHLGMAQYHALLAVPRGMVGICLTATGPLMLPTYGREARLGSNPIAVAVPCGAEPTFVYDASTTVIAVNKLAIANRIGAALPPGLIAAEDGAPIMEPVPAPPHSFRLLPIGSTPEMGSYKGYGLGCVVEILTNVLGGLTFGFRLGPGSHNHCVAAIDVRAFADLDDFTRAMDDFMRVLKDTPPVPGRERVLAPGQLEWEAEQERRAKGIPLHRTVVDWFQGAGAGLGV